jgi:hypothetical protein
LVLVKEGDKRKAAVVMTVLYELDYGDVPDDGARHETLPAHKVKFLMTADEVKGFG